MMRGVLSLVVRSRWYMDGESVTLEPAWETGMNPEVFKIPIIKGWQSYIA